MTHSTFFQVSKNCFSTKIPISWDNLSSKTKDKWQTPFIVFFSFLSDDSIDICIIKQPNICHLAARSSFGDKKILALIAARASKLKNPSTCKYFSWLLLVAKIQLNVTLPSADLQLELSITLFFLFVCPKKKSKLFFLKKGNEDLQKLFFNGFFMSCFEDRWICFNWWFTRASNSTLSRLESFQKNLGGKTKRLRLFAHFRSMDLMNAKNIFFLAIIFAN